MYVKVRVFPKAKKENLVVIGTNRFEIKVKEKAEKNMANRKILQLIAEHFGVREKDVKIVNGHHHPSKLISVNID